MLRSLKTLPVLPGSSLIRGAHHPHCPRHGNHLIWIKSRPLCLGCFCMGTGLAIGVVAYCTVPLLDIPLIPWLGLNAIMVAPTALQPWIQIKVYKAIARTLLGVGTTAWLLGCVTANRTSLPWAIEGGLGIAVFMLLARLLWMLRERRTASPCTTCPHGAYPTCSWNLPRLLAETDDQEVVEAFVRASRSGHIAIWTPEQPVISTDDRVGLKPS